MCCEIRHILELIGVSNLFCTTSSLFVTHGKRLGEVRYLLGANISLLLQFIRLHGTEARCPFRGLLSSSSITLALCVSLSYLPFRSSILIRSGPISCTKIATAHSVHGVYAKYKFWPTCHVASGSNSSRPEASLGSLLIFEYFCRLTVPRVVFQQLCF
jgi:hypothetical protein